MDGYVIIDIDARDPAAHIILQTQRRRERIQVDASTFHFNQNYNKLGITSPILALIEQFTIHTCKKTV